MKSHINVMARPIQIMIDYVRRRSLDRQLMANYLNLKKNARRKLWVYC